MWQFSKKIQFYVFMCDAEWPTSYCAVPVRIVKLLTQHVVRGDSWAACFATGGSTCQNLRLIVITGSKWTAGFL